MNHITESGIIRFRIKALLPKGDHYDLVKNWAFHPLSDLTTSLSFALAFRALGELLLQNTPLT